MNPTWVVLLHTALDYAVEFAEVAVFGFLVAGLLQQFVCAQALQRLVSGGVVRANLAGALIGFATPLCCCTAIPTAMSLFRQTQRAGPACAFLIATPWFNWYGLSALIIFLGPRNGVAVAAAAVLTGWGTGMLVDGWALRLSRVAPASPALGREGIAEASVTCAPAESSCATERCGCGPGELVSAEGSGWFDFHEPARKLRAALGTAIALFRELAPWIGAGILLGAAAKVYLPADWVSRYLSGEGIAGVGFALMFAGIVYTDSLGSLPFVHALLEKGMGPGNAMILLVAGVGSNVSTLGPVARAMGRRSATLYALGVLVITGILGLALNR